MSSRVQVRGCCCGIPFGCGVLAFGALPLVVAGLAGPSWLAMGLLPLAPLAVGAMQVRREAMATGETPRTSEPTAPPLG